MKVEITDWKVLIKIIWKLEIWYNNNRRKLNKQQRKKIKKILDDMTWEAQKMKEAKK